MDGSIWQRDTADFAWLYCAALPPLSLILPSEVEKVNVIVSFHLLVESWWGPEQNLVDSKKAAGWSIISWPALTAVDVAFSNQGPIKKLISMRERGGGRAQADCIQLHAHCDSSGGFCGWRLFEAAETLLQLEDEFLLELQIGWDWDHDIQNGNISV